MSRMMHLFRKYQYVLLIVFGVLLMFVFVIGDALTKLTGAGSGGRAPAAEVVLTWKHGAVTGNDLYSQQVRHNIALEFLSAVVEETVRREGTPKGPGVFRDQFGRYNPGIAVAEDEAAIVQKMLLAAKAESLGVKVDNNAVKAFLAQLSDEELDDDDLAVIYNKTVAGRMTQQHLMDQLQHELLAQQMLMMTRAGLFVVPPREAWEFHNRIGRRVQTEMVALQVDSFKDKVSQLPTDAEIEQLYEEGKDRFPNPYSPEVAFKRRRKLGFEYVRADSGKLEAEEAAKIKDTITDEEIEKYYEENKSRYRVIELPEEEPATEKPDANPDAAPESSEKPADEPQSDQPSEPAPGEPAPGEPAPGEPAPGEPAPGEPALDKPADAPAKPETPKDDAAPQPPAEEKPTPEKPADSQPEPAPAAEEPAGEQPAASEETDFEIEEETEADASEPAATPEPPAPKPPAPEPPAPEPPAPEPPPAEASAPVTAKEDVPAEATEAPAPAAEATTEKDTGAPATEEKPDEPRYKPLDDKLRAEIRDEIAADRSRQPARERLDKMLDEIKAAIDAYGRQARRADVAKSEDKPAPVDYEKLATDRGFTAGKIDPTDVIGIDDYDLGKAYEMTFTSWPPQRVSFAQMAFQENVQAYRAQRIKSAELDIEFLYWKTEEEEAYVPKLEDIRDEVVDAWKHREAFVIAKAEAEKLAEQAAADKPLGESLSEHDGLEIIQPAPFSWMSTGSTPFGGAGAPTLSRVDGVEAAGNDFMKSVFSLKQGEVGVAVDQPQAMVYVVRIAAETPSEEILREQFLASGVTPEMSRIAFVEIEDIWQDWYKDLEEEMKVKWKE